MSDETPVRILVVDDDPAIRASVADALGGEALEILVAANAQEALGLLDAGPDVVLSDVKMPGVGGLELLLSIKERVPSADVILMTAYDNVPTVVTAMRGGAVDFLCKPLDLQELRQVIQRVIAGRERSSDHPRSTGSTSGGAPSLSSTVRSTASDPSEALCARLRHTLAPAYRVERRLGSGGTAVVFLAQDRKHGRQVAIKVLRPELAASVGNDRFLREIRIAAQLNHPHVLTLIDSGSRGGLVYYVMPFVDGESLRERLTRETRLTVPDAVRLLIQLADALSAAHAQGIVHRDVKPENVLLAGRHAVVTDFGVAKAIHEASGGTATATGLAVGTPAYMSPEQAAGSPDIDHRSDIYGLGALAYEMLAGRPPFEGRTLQALLAAHVTELPTPLGRHCDGLLSELELVVMRCLAKHPSDRWRTADELLARLEQFTTPPGGVASPTPGGGSGASTSHGPDSV